MKNAPDEKSNNNKNSNMVFPLNLLHIMKRKFYWKLSTNTLLFISWNHSYINASLLPKIFISLFSEHFWKKKYFLNFRLSKQKISHIAQLQINECVPNYHFNPINCGCMTTKSFVRKKMAQIFSVFYLFVHKLSFLCYWNKKENFKGI